LIAARKADQKTAPPWLKPGARDAIDVAMLPARRGFRPADFW